MMMLTEMVLRVIEPLTPYAVELRYDAEFWPTKEDANDAMRRAKQVVDQVEKELGIT